MPREETVDPADTTSSEDPEEIPGEIAPDLPTVDRELYPGAEESGEGEEETKDASDSEALPDEVSQDPSPLIAGGTWVWVLGGLGAAYFATDLVQRHYSS